MENCNCCGKKHRPHRKEKNLRVPRIVQFKKRNKHNKLISTNLTIKLLPLNLRKSDFSPTEMR